MMKNKFWSDVKKQERYVQDKMNSGSTDYLKEKGYSSRKIKGYLRQDYHGSRQSDSYVLDSDIREEPRNRVKPR